MNTLSEKIAAIKAGLDGAPDGPWDLGKNVAPISAFFENPNDAWLSWIALMKSNPRIKFSLLDEAGEVLAEYTPS